MKAKPSQIRIFSNIFVLFPLLFGSLSCSQSGFNISGLFPGTSQSSQSTGNGGDIGSQTNANLAALPPSSGGSILIPAGNYTQTTTINLTGNNVHVVGDPMGVTLNYDGSQIAMIDGMENVGNWSSNPGGLSLSTVSSIGPQNPSPAQGFGYLQVVTSTSGGNSQSVIETLPHVINMSSFQKIGLYVSSNINGNWPNPSQADSIQFFIVDSQGRQDVWNVSLLWDFGCWSPTELTLSSPNVNGGASLNSIVKIGFQNLKANTKYYFDSVMAYNPLVPAFTFTNCTNCSVENVTINWMQAGLSTSAIRFYTNNSNSSVLNSSISGGGTGIIIGDITNYIKIANSTVANAFASGIWIGNANNAIFDTNIINHNLYGIWESQAVSGASYTNNSFYNNNVEAMALLGHGGDTINANHVNMWTMYGIFLVGGFGDVVSNNEFYSTTGQTCLQLFDGASYTSINGNTMLTCGGTGIDINGNGVGLGSVQNTITGNAITYTGASNWNGGTNLEEGKGITLVDASDNSISNNTIANAGTSGGLTSQIEGIYIDYGSNNNIFTSNIVRGSANEGVIIWDGHNNKFYQNSFEFNGYTDAAGNDSYRQCYENCGTSTAVYGEPGMTLTSGASGTVLNGNTFAGNAGGAIVDSETGTIYGTGNIGLPNPTPAPTP